MIKINKHCQERMITRFGNIIIPYLLFFLSKRIRGWNDRVSNKKEERGRKELHKIGRWKYIYHPKSKTILTFMHSGQNFQPIYFF